MIVSLIVAMDERGGIGKDNKLPWILPSDLRRFKQITMGHHLVMGRKTYETIGKPLPGRVMIIVTRQKNFHAKDCIVVQTIKDALLVAEKNLDDEVFVIGGGEIFRQVVSISDRIYLTQVHADVGATVYFPSINQADWETITTEEPVQSDRDQYPSNFKILVRKH